MFLPQFIHTVFYIIYLILLARVIFSWMPVSSRAPALQGLHSFTYQVTEPLLQPIRRFLASYQGRLPVDFSPLSLFVLLKVVERILLRLYYL